MASWENVVDRTADRKPVGDLPDGIHYGLTYEEYDQIPAVNYSKLKAAFVSPRHYRYGVVREETAYFRLGSLIHAGHLEPETVSGLYAVEPTVELIRQVGPDPKTGSAYARPTATKKFGELRDAWAAKYATGKTVVSEEEFRTMQGCVTALAEHPEASELFNGAKTEVVVLAHDPNTGLPLKVRLDAVKIPKSKSQRALIGDLKTTEDLYGFDPFKYGYEIQAAFYSKVLDLVVERFEVPQFHLAVIEKCPPFGIQVAPFEPAELADAYELVSFLLRQIAEATSKRRWPGPRSPSYWTRGCRPGVRSVAAARERFYRETRQGD